MKMSCEQPKLAISHKHIYAPFSFSAEANILDFNKIYHNIPHNLYLKLQACEADGNMQHLNESK